MQHPVYFANIKIQRCKRIIYRIRRFKSKTNQLQYNLNSDTCPACPCPKSYSSVQLALCCCVSFCTTLQVSLFGLSQSAAGFYIILIKINTDKKLNVRALGATDQQ